MSALIGWMDLERRARLIVTSRGEVLWISAMAAALLEAGSPFQIRAGQLIGRTPWVSEQVQLLLDSVDDSARSWVLEARDAVIWAQQIPSAGTVSIGLTIHWAADELDITPLAEARSLTAAEARIVRMMLGGTETGRIAQALDISVSTLRTHMKHVYRKLGVNSRGELFAKARPFLGP